MTSDRYFLGGAGLSNFFSLLCPPPDDLWSTPQGILTRLNILPIYRKIKTHGLSYYRLCHHNMQSNNLTFLLQLYVCLPLLSVPSRVSCILQVQPPPNGSFSVPKMKQKLLHYMYMYTQYVCVCTHAYTAVLRIIIFYEIKCVLVLR